MTDILSCSPPTSVGKGSGLGGNGTSLHYAQTSESQLIGNILHESDEQNHNACSASPTSSLSQAHQKQHHHHAHFYHHTTSLSQRASPSPPPPQHQHQHQHQHHHDHQIVDSRRGYSNHTTHHHNNNNVHHPKADAHSHNSTFNPLLPYSAASAPATSHASHEFPRGARADVLHASYASPHLLERIPSHLHSSTSHFDAHYTTNGNTSSNNNLSSCSPSLPSRSSSPPLSSDSKSALMRALSAPTLLIESNESSILNALRVSNHYPSTGNDAAEELAYDLNQLKLASSSGVIAKPSPHPPRHGSMSTASSRSASPTNAASITNASHHHNSHASMYRSISAATLAGSRNTTRHLPYSDDYSNNSSPASLPSTLSNHSLSSLHYASTSPSQSTTATSTPSPSSTSPASSSLSLLDDFKLNNKHSHFSLPDLIARNLLFELSTDQYGSRYIQQKLESATAHDRAEAFNVLSRETLRLCTDVFGNYVVQKLFEYGSVDQQTVLVVNVQSNVFLLSLQMYGCRVIQKAIEVCGESLQQALVYELHSHVLQCVKDQNGNHVIQKVIERCPPHMYHFILQQTTHHALHLAIHPYGCRVIQRLLEHSAALPEPSNVLMTQLCTQVDELSRHQYGNYVIQHTLIHGTEWHKTCIINTVQGKVVIFSKHKFASNVMEKCIEYTPDHLRERLIDEILGNTHSSSNNPSPSSSLHRNNHSHHHSNHHRDSLVDSLCSPPHMNTRHPLLAMIADQYGNYVIQKLLDVIENEHKYEILLRMKHFLPSLRKIPYGKHILARIEKMHHWNSSLLHLHTHTDRFDRKPHHHQSLTSATISLQHASSTGSSASSSSLASLHSSGYHGTHSANNGNNGYAQAYQSQSIYPSSSSAGSSSSVLSPHAPLFDPPSLIASRHHHHSQPQEQHHSSLSSSFHFASSQQPQPSSSLSGSYHHGYASSSSFASSAADSSRYSSTALSSAYDGPISPLSHSPQSQSPLSHTSYLATNGNAADHGYALTNNHNINTTTAITSACNPPSQQFNNIFGS